MFKVNLKKINDDAFNTSHFAPLQKIIISDAPISLLSKGAFNGLKNLHRMSFNRVNFKMFETNILASTPNLKKFKMENCGKQQINADNLFGMVSMHYLGIVEIIKCNLGDTITENTFLGLSNVSELRLLSDEITIIGPKSFDVPLRNLKILQLNINKLKMLPNGIFAERKMSKISIELHRNEWHCDCDLDYLQKVIRSKSNTVLKNSVVCSSPSRCEGLPSRGCLDRCEPITSLNTNVRARSNTGVTQFKTKTDGHKVVEEFGHVEKQRVEDDSEEEPKYVSNVLARKHTEATKFTTKTDEFGYESDTESKSDNEFESYNEYENITENRDVEYYEENVYENVPEDFNGFKDKDNRFKNQSIVKCEDSTAKVSLTNSHNGMLSIRIDQKNLYLISKNLPPNHTLTGIEQEAKSDGVMKCLGSFEDGDEHVEIEFKLKPNKIYRFCRMYKNSNHTRLLECILYYSKMESDELDAWLLTESKSIIISICVIFAFFILFMGSLFSMILDLIFTKRIRPRRSIIEKVSRTIEEQMAINRLK